MRRVFVAVALVFPVLLLLGALAMERVERPLERSHKAHRAASKKAADSGGLPGGG